LKNVHAAANKVPTNATTQSSAKVSSNSSISPLLS
jgi:hypothetical protein